MTWLVIYFYLHVTNEIILSFIFATKKSSLGRSFYIWNFETGIVLARFLYQKYKKDLFVS